MRMRRRIYRDLKKTNKPARHAIWSHSVTKRVKQETGHCSCVYTITYFMFNAVVSGFCWLLTDARRPQSKVSARISFLLPDPWSWGYPFLKNIQDSGLGLLLVLLGRACRECMCLWKRHFVISPPGQSRSRNLSKTQFTLLSSVFLQYCSPRTVPRLFPAEACAESLLVNGFFS